MTNPTGEQQQDQTQIAPPPWLDLWTKPSQERHEYPDQLVALLRHCARKRESFELMVEFPPRCVIAFKDEKGDVVYGIVVAVPWFEMPHPGTGFMRLVQGIRYVPSPVHFAKQEGDAYVLPKGVQVLGYAPAWTPDVMRMLLRPPAGQA